MLTGRLSSTVLTLATTTIVVRSLSPAEFGFWVVLTGLPFLVAQFDLGVGNALRNKLTVLAATGEGEKEARLHFFACLFIFLAGALVLSVLTAALVSFLPWGRILGADAISLLQAAPRLAAWGAAALFFSMALSLGGSGFFAYQEAHINAGLDTFRNLLVLALTAAVWLLKGGTVAMTAVYFFGLIFGALASLLLFLRRRGWSWMLPGRNQILEMWRALRGQSARFFVLQMSSGLIIYTDSVLVARLAGFGPAGDYALVQKIFLYLIALQFMVLVPLWSAFTDAHARGDHGWLRRMFRRSFWMTLVLTGGGALALAVFGERLTSLWTGRVVGTPLLFSVMALWTVAYGWCNCFSVPLNALGILGRQAPLSFAAAVVNIPLCLWWGGLWGPVGICWAAIVVMLPIALSNTLEVRSVLNTLPLEAAPCNPKSAS